MTIQQREDEINDRLQELDYVTCDHWTDAHAREVEALEAELQAIAQGTNMSNPISNDPRYTINPEWCGYKEQRYVARFCGEWIEQSLSYSAMVLRCVGHKAVMNGAPVFVNQPVKEA